MEHPTSKESGGREIIQTALEALSERDPRAGCAVLSTLMGRVVCPDSRAAVPASADAPADNVAALLAALAARSPHNVYLGMFFIVNARQFIGMLGHPRAGVRRAGMDIAVAALLQAKAHL